MDIHTSQTSIASVALSKSIDVSKIWFSEIVACWTHQRRLRGIINSICWAATPGHRQYEFDHESCDLAQVRESGRTSMDPLFQQGYLFSSEPAFRNLHRGEFIDIYLFRRTCDVHRSISFETHLLCGGRNSELRRSPLLTEVSFDSRRRKARGLQRHPAPPSPTNDGAAHGAGTIRQSKIYPHK